MRRFVLACLLAGAFAWSGCTSPPSTTPTTPSGPTTENYQGLIVPNGFVAHDFAAADTGPVTVTFTVMSPSIPMGFGLGTPPVVPGPGCNLTRSMVTTAGSAAQLSVTADAGLYCVELYDVGNLVGAVGPKGQGGFTITIVHP